MSSTERALSKTEADTTSFADTSHSSIKSRSSVRVSQLGSARAALKEYLQSHQTHMTTAGDETAHRFENEIRSAIKEQQIASTEFMSQIAAEFSAGKLDVGQFSGEYQAQSGQVVGDLASFVLREYQSTGTTPQKKEFSFPRNLARTKPKDILLQEYRKQREAGVDLEDMLQSAGSRTHLTDVVQNEATSTSTISIDDDIAESSSAEELVAPIVAQVKPVEQAPTVVVPSASAALPRGPSNAKLTAAASNAKKPAPSQPAAKPTASALPRAPSGVVPKKPVPAPHAAANAAGKKLTRAPSKSQLQEITNK